MNKYQEMREIKFRGKRIDNGEWVFGDFIRHYENQRRFIACDQLAYTYSECGIDRLVTESFYEVAPETVGQYTGLKDKNGVEVYEGDIHEYDGRHFSVKFGYYTDDDIHVEMYGWYLDSNSLEEQGSLGVDSEKYVNIIGNIHENPELLKENKYE